MEDFIFFNNKKNCKAAGILKQISTSWNSFKRSFWDKSVKKCCVTVQTLIPAARKVGLESTVYTPKILEIFYTIRASFQGVKALHLLLSNTHFSGFCNFYAFNICSIKKPENRNAFQYLYFFQNAFWWRHTERTISHPPANLTQGPGWLGLTAETCAILSANSTISACVLQVQSNSVFDTQSLIVLCRCCHVRLKV